ncbi:FimD/PapC N-terminal domain-containing protein, partial [Erwinia amylovora]|uniref:FimD/PapC N-terminal domain-containing protein n=1 Tax=Erwinia amylovora TaxID=552 RepID=UPI00296242FB
MTLAIATAMGFGAARAGDKLDMSFIHGGAGIDRESWAALNGTYAPGRYLVDVSLNSKDVGKQILNVTPHETEALCLTQRWLEKSGIYLSRE